MHIACGSELASEGCCLNDCAVPAGCWQGSSWLGIEGMRAQELALHAVHREHQDLPVSSLSMQSLVCSPVKDNIIVQYVYLAISAITAIIALDHAAIS